MVSGSSTHNISGQVYHTKLLKSLPGS